MGGKEFGSIDFFFGIVVRRGVAVTQRQFFQDLIYGQQENQSILETQRCIPSAVFNRGI